MNLSNDSTHLLKIKIKSSSDSFLEFLPLLSLKTQLKIKSLIYFKKPILLMDFLNCQDTPMMNLPIASEVGVKENKNINTIKANHFS